MNMNPIQLCHDYDGHKPIRIVIIDDSVVDLELLTHLLGELPNVEIVQFSDSQKALAFVLSEQGASIDAVLCDWNMPVFKGSDVLKAFKQVHQQTPFIVVTGEGTSETVAESRQLGADEFVVKPFYSRTLLEKVQQCLPAQ